MLHRAGSRLRRLDGEDTPNPKWQQTVAERMDDDVAVRQINFAHSKSPGSASKSGSKSQPSSSIKRAHTPSSYMHRALSRRVMIQRLLPFLTARELASCTARTRPTTRQTARASRSEWHAGVRQSTKARMMARDVRQCGPGACPGEGRGGLR